MNNNTPLVSVVIPGYNHAPYLRERIDSVLSQDYPCFEVIMLDDCSPDNSAEIMQGYADRFSKGEITAHAQDVSFWPNERNSGNTFLQWEKGIGLAKGEFVWIAESDDVATPDFLSKMMSKLLSTPDSVLAFCMSEMIDSYSKPLSYSWDETSRLRADGVYDGRDFCFHRLVLKNLLYNASMIVFRRSCFERIPKDYQTCRNAGDWLFWYYVCKMGKVCEVPEKLNMFRQHTNKVSTQARNSGEDFRDMASVQSIITRDLSLGKWAMMSLRGRQTKRIRKHKPQNMQELIAQYPQIYSGTLADTLVYTIDKCLNISGLQK